ncbi:amidohydrolase family protein [Planosporangium flavigriseum]|uniref:Amidohydrolase n=1 Tax=Planosporangium flavigriseum TaxID=373681 RepID=A0A8J3LMU0_9ACTN|nr:amidohydrolase family protein [Planosporangium flavigriseum]NJC66535.1 amidohydrolase family protein [Planosporangium flavigriseum]GIG73408.1 amidohydrolase [Planosporangium flavigriseum]
MTGIRRRNLLAGVAGAAAIAGTGVGTADPAQAASRTPGAGRTVDLREGTDLAAQVSPEGRMIAIDVVGVLWVLPASGGPARRLTSDLFDIAQPEWSPDGSTITFQSYRDGVFNIWTIRPDGSGLRQLTHGPYDHREPRFSPDGRRIVFSSDLSGSYGIHTLDLVSGAVTPVTDTPAEEYEPAWSPDGSRIAFVVANTRIDVVEVATGARSTAVTVPAGQVIHSPAWTPDSHDLVYSLTVDGRSELWRSGTPLVIGEEVFGFRVSWPSPHEFVYTADGAIRRRAVDGGAARNIGFVAPVTVVRPAYRRRQRDFDSAIPKQVKGIGSPVLSPDGKHVAYRALNDIYTMRIGQPSRPLTRDHWWKCDPAWSPDGRYLSYSTDRGGKLDIWLRDLRTGSDRQLTHLPGAAAVSGTWSHDGSHLAFLDQTGALYTVEVASGDVRKVFTATFEPGRPTWSADGNVIALAAIKPYSARYREGLSKILLVDRRTGAGTYIDPLPGRSIQTRGDDGPVWSPDGTTMAFVVASVLWVVDVHPDGTFAGAPRQLTHEVTDAVSWSGDSTRLLYLNNGRLRLVSADGTRTQTVPVRLTWTNTQPRGRTVIRAGRMWDGSSRQLRDDVDIVVEGHRIVAVEPHRPSRAGRIVDAGDSVVIPGLIDMHHHREMQGYCYGDRQGRLWLSLGVTTTRSPGSPAYHMVEAREAVQSGARVAPRYFATGEAVDGPRIFYNFMRPTFDEHQLALELQRAGALDYDLMKAYVRLPTEWQRAVTEWAHRRGIPITSHYHYPAFAFGGDGMEHIGATNRFGYSRTVTALGTGYRDVIDIFNASQAVRAPTLFGANTLLREDTSLVTDRRVTTLYPSWEYASLQAAATAAKTTDQTVARENLARQVAQITAMIRGGGRVITGTDSPIAFNAISVHLNLRAMVKYGLTPYEALTTATRVPGEFLAEPVGQIRPGSYADLAVLAGNPLEDINQAANVRQVMANGELHTVDELLAPFGTATRTAAAVTTTVLEPVPDHPANAGYWWHDPHYVRESRHSCCAGA